MVSQESTGFCKDCNRQVLLRRQGTNHILHFLLTCASLGAWIFIWALASIKIGGWRCSLCGMKMPKDFLK